MTDLVLGIFGPTASGKTAIAGAIAERIPADLVSADSMQVYRGLEILTNQSPARLVGIWPLAREASVGEYQELAHAEVDAILAAGRTPVVVGGTGLYLRAALADLDLPPPPAPGERERWERLYDAEGAEAAHGLLAERDPAAAAVVHPNDRRRVVRALELAETGRSLAPAHGRLWSADARHPTLIVAIDLPAEMLAERIERRTRSMFERGVQQEVRRALREPISSTARAVLGLDAIATLPRDEAIAAVIVSTRRYAAYQRKWMRRIGGVVTVAGDRAPEEVADEILALARTRERLPADGRGGAHA